MGLYGNVAAVEKFPHGAIHACRDKTNLESGLKINRGYHWIVIGL